MTLLDTRPRQAVRVERPVPPHRAVPRPVLGGICVRIAAALDVHVAWPRVAFALAAFAGGAGVLIYLGAWLAFPANRSTEEMTTDIGAQAGLLAGGILIAMGSMVLIGTVAGSVGTVAIWPMTVLVAGALLLRSTRPAAR